MRFRFLLAYLVSGVLRGAAVDGAAAGTLFVLRHMRLFCSSRAIPQQSLPPLSHVHTTQQERILDTAVVALERTTGINARVHPVTVGRARETDAIIEVETDRYKDRFGAEVKTVDRFATPAMLKAQSQALHDLPLLIAPYITREVAEHCRQLRLPFIDTAGNAYLEAAGLLVYVVGQARPVEHRQDTFRALTPAGLKLTFALLCRPQAA
jgi:hypothetical protein